MSEKQYPNTFQDAREVHQDIVAMPEGGADYIKDMSNKIDGSSQAALRANVGLPLLMHPDRKKIPEHASARRSERGLSKLTKGVAGLALAGAVAFGVNEKLDGSANANFDKIEQEALGEVDRAWNSVVVFHEGVKYRKAPKTVNTEPEEGPNTVAGVIPEGQVLRINNPIVYTEAPENGNGTTWLGFTLEGEDTAETKNVYWANFTELNDQQSNGNPLVSVYDYPEVADAKSKGDYDPHFDVDINLGEQILGSIGMKGGPVAEGNMVTTEAFDNALKQEQLVFAHK